MSYPPKADLVFLAKSEILRKIKKKTGRASKFLMRPVLKYAFD